ncbi:MAG: hypothetical protein H7Y16_00040 [Candidatus Parcubacteria bacterium]|nr:hypothetical protein [Burkholderiales bacterium]
MRTLHVSVREARMCVDRILLTCGLPHGYVHGVRECVLLSEALGLGGFKHLYGDHATLQMENFSTIRVTEGDPLTVDAAGLHAWLLLPTLVDLAVDIARKAGNSRLKVLRVAHREELQVAAGLAKRHGTEFEVSGDLLTVQNTSRPRTAEQWDPLLHAAMRDGFDVEETLWRAVHRFSNGALAPDSVVSRRHAGPVILTDDGSIAGRLPQDDDFDLNMLKKVAP